MTRTAETIEFERPWLILCEGDDDKQVIERLIVAHALDGRFHVTCPVLPGDRTGGRGKFGRWLSMTRNASETFRDNVNAVLIISDNDDDPENSFHEIKMGLTKTKGFGVPQTERAVARMPGYPDVVVMMIPGGEPGSVETLCLRAAYNKWPIEAPLDAYVAATPANAWRPGKQSKMRVHALLAATCETKPSATLANHWQERVEFHVPLTDPAFADIVTFLRNFEAMISAPPAVQQAVG